MRACVQRVAEARVRVEGQIVGEIGPGLLVLLGVAADDQSVDVHYLADKITTLRIFEDEDGKMNRSVIDTGGGVLVVSQFTLLGDCRKGRRPGFSAAAPPELAARLYEDFVAETRRVAAHVATGQFREQMRVELVNDGPVTMLLDSRKLF
ncbi:MAG: D-tyrosyl-tRNA(Tyr) deacylase [Pirellulales bacterium]|nr:D-tyrosyl-tRNA(Tyr) deacylase [Pirellulales bacterium]